MNYTAPLIERETSMPNIFYQVSICREATALVWSRQGYERTGSGSPVSRDFIEPDSYRVDESTFGAPSVSDAMPVAGTYITQRELTGQWAVQISLDGSVVRSQ